MIITFKGYSATVKTLFTCTKCKKDKRTRSFTESCTLNPFNKEATTPAEIREQSRKSAQEDVDEFMKEPVCKSCENGMEYPEWKK